MKDEKLHNFQCNVSGIEPPTQFTYPFHYVPHELCRLAAQEVMEYALSRYEWHNELLAGKMMGVLVVRDHDGSLGYLAAYSGNLAHNGDNPYFVPHIYNLLEPKGLFRSGEAQISEINHHIETLEKSAKRKELESLINNTIAEQEQEEKEMRLAMEDAKHRRDKQRQAGDITSEQEQLLIKESQFQKAELRRLKKYHHQQLERLTEKLNEYQAIIDQLKAKRKSMSEALQMQLFKLFVVNNAKGESKDVATIFEQSLNRLPPGGTGDCCAPKLLQYAFLHQLHPVCMAEFWVGESPQGEIRHHGHYYPACQNKCKPLLEFMLQGLDVEKNPLVTSPIDNDIKIVYEDNWLIVVDKPAGMLTVPGKDDRAISLLERIGTMLRDGEEAFEVHRLDQATSGLVVIAKTREVQRLLRQQFENRKVNKTYLALLDGEPANNEGIIDLPIRPDLNDRPRQVVDLKHGKQAITEYRVIERRHDKTLVEFIPLTGRTHQLRVHASHPQGLNCPITGDMLYGTASDRLYLHAKTISFSHPITRENLCFTSNNS